MGQYSVARRTTFKRWRDCELCSDEADGRGAGEPDDAVLGARVDLLQVTGVHRLTACCRKVRQKPYN